MPDPDFDFMEDFTRRNLRGLPPRPAPAALEGRVRARIEAAPRRRSALRPAAVVLSVAAAAAFVAVPALVARHGGAGSVFDLLAGRFSAVAVLQALWTGLSEAVQGTCESLPRAWCAWGLAAVALAYAALAGLGTAAYRLFFRSGRRGWSALS
ncbi:MAG TPA: hypothetical protein VHC86_12325 [Opitutaceae bacterium]|nr:hypothetical protein [Opitutaceae bacterium]